jgi:hypothetical protein
VCEFQASVAVPMPASRLFHRSARWGQLPVTDYTEYCVHVGSGAENERRLVVAGQLEPYPQESGRPFTHQPVFLPGVNNRSGRPSTQASFCHRGTGSQQLSVTWLFNARGSNGADVPPAMCNLGSSCGLGSLHGVRLS